VAEQKKFGYQVDDKIREIGKAVVNNPTVRSVASGAKDMLFDYAIDPSAEQLTRVSSYRPLGLPSILDIMTPKTPPGSYEDVRAITQNPTDPLKKITPYVYNPNVTAGERFGMHVDEGIAAVKYYADRLFGNAQKAGVQMVQEGVPFDELPPELKAGTYQYLANVAGLAAPYSKPIMAGGKAATMATGNTVKQVAKDVGNVVSKKDSGFRLSAGGEKAVTGKSSPTEIFFANPKNLESIKGDRQLAGLTPRLPETLKLADVIDQMSLEDIGTKNIRQIATENNLTTLINQTDEFGRLNIAVRRGINKFGLINAEKLNLLDYNAKPNVRNNEGYKKVFDFMNNLEEGTTFSTQKELAEAIGVTPSVLKHAIGVDKNITGNIRNQVNSAVDRAPVGSGLPDPAKRFKSEVASLFKNRQGFKEYFDQIDKETLDAITKVRGEGGYTVSTRSAFRIFEDYMYDKYRSVKQTTGNSKLTAKQFVNNYIDDSDLDNFSNYLKLERDRTILGVSGKDVIDDLATDSKYLPYLQNKNGDIDYTLLQADKAHDVPLFLSRIEGRNKKYKDVGRFKGAGIEPEIISPNFQAYNYLQANLDPFVNAAADVLTQKGLKEKYMKMPVKVIKTTAGKQNLSKDNIISTGLLKKLEEYGYKPDIKKFNNQFEFVNEISNVIDNIYKDRLIRTIVPVRGPAGKKDNVIFGIEDTQNVSINQKLMLGGERLKEILDYAIEKGISPQDLRDSKGYIRGFEEGGLVGDMTPVKANVGGFFARMFGKPPKFREEGMDLLDVAKPTKKQAATLESLYPGAAFPETYPGEVFYSNLELSLSKRDAPKIFTTDKEFYDYINKQGVGVDEMDDAKVSSYVTSKAREGQPIMSDDIISIAQQSPLRKVYIDGYGFRSDKVNLASKDKFDSRTGQLIQAKGQGINKNPSYAGTGLKDGYIENSYRERVLRLPKESLRGDPGTIPGGNSPHRFGTDFGDESNVYTIGWTRQTDRPGFVISGQAVDKQTGDIIMPSAVADLRQLQSLEEKIKKTFEDPISKLRVIDGLFDESQAGDVAKIVDDLVSKSGGRLDRDKAFGIVLQQARQKQNQIKKLQGQYVAEKERVDNFKPQERLDVTATIIDEAQSDVMQNANRKARELALRLDVMAEDGIPIEQMRDRELLDYFKSTGGVSRPVGKTKEELLTQYEELKQFSNTLKNLSEMRPFQIPENAINNYRNNIKKRQTQIIDSMSDNISKDLMESLYPDLPLKDRVQYLDALFKQSVAEAAYRLFVEKDPTAPKFIGIMGGKQVTNAYSQSGSTMTPIDDIVADKTRRITDFKNSIRQGNTGAKIQKSEFPGVGTYEFYGGPEARDPSGKHYTGAAEAIMNKIAQEYGSKLQIINIATQRPRTSEVFKIVDQDTGGVVGSGETYRQAETIANDLVDNQGGRYRIERGQIKNFDSEPVFGFELQPQMLQLFKVYK
tara:strand:- start:2521 stop:6879 length:4359 start_codon:yes stop_codon:yes gene_type:complete